MNNHVNPSTDERKAIVAAAADLFRSRFYSPDLDGFDLDHTLAERMPELLSTIAFSSALRDVFAGSGAQPIDVYHESHKRIPLSRFLKATLFQRSEDDLVFRDVLVGGRAREAKIQSGDRLLKVNGTVPDSEGFRINAYLGLELIVEGRSGSSRKLSFGAPSSYKAKPEQNVEFQKLNDDVGHIRIASWPGILGIEVARETDAAIRALKCKRLIVDLRGNFGSVGAGNLRLMSYLTPERVPVGYSLTRRRAEDGYDRESLPRFERIPRLKLQGLPILWKFRKLDKSIVVVTEGLGRQEFHGQTVILVNRHTISGAEIVVHFAKQHGLAVVVGEGTAGRSLSIGTFALPNEFRFTFPIGDYIPWSGHRFEGCGVEPDVPVAFASSPLGSQDEELEVAKQIVQRGSRVKHQVMG